MAGAVRILEAVEHQPDARLKQSARRLYVLEAFGGHFQLFVSRHEPQGRVVIRKGEYDDTTNDEWQEIGRAVMEYEREHYGLPAPEPYIL